MSCANEGLKMYMEQVGNLAPPLTHRASNPTATHSSRMFSTSAYSTAATCGAVHQQARDQYEFMYRRGSVFALHINFALRWAVDCCRSGCSCVAHLQKTAKHAPFLSVQKQAVKRETLEFPLPFKLAILCAEALAAPDVARTGGLQFAHHSTTTG
jgi:hypothetical protein